MRISTPNDTLPPERTDSQEGRVNRADKTQPARKSSDVTKKNTEGPSVVLAPRTADLAKRVMADRAAREARVESVKQAFEDGSYQVDTDALAERLVSEELARWGG